MPDARLEAFQVLRQVERGSGYAQDLIASHIARNRPDPRDASLLAEIVYGVLRRRLTLDSVLASFSRTPPARMDWECLSLLRLGAYQILFLDRIPPSAAVNESVKMASKVGVSSAKGFINAVLRSLLRGLVHPRAERPASPSQSVHLRLNTWAVFNKPVLPDPGAGQAAYLAAAYSHPEWLVAGWLARFGEEGTVSILRADNETPPLTVRVNRLKTDRAALLRRLRAEGVEAGEGEAPLAVRLSGAARIGGLASFQEGLYQVQDETSMRAVELLDPRPGETILDLCAAPGGKATQIAEQMEDRGILVAADRSIERLHKVRENLQRLGIRCVRCVAADCARPWTRASALFDRVLVDAPCSNTGVLGRRVEARWRVTRNEVLQLARLQRALLMSAADVARPGGVVVYSTCSIEAEENEALVAEVAAETRLEKRSEQMFLPRSEMGGGYVALLVRR